MHHVLTAVLVAASLALTSCSLDGEDGKGGDRPRAGCSGRGGEAGTVKLRYRVESGPASPGSFSETVSALCSRLARLGLRRVAVEPAGADLVVRTPPKLEADVRAAAMAGRLGFYDWDANVSGRTGPYIPFSGPTALFDAVGTASRMRPRAEATDVVPGGPPDPEEADRANDTAPGPRYYLFDSERRAIAGPAWSRGGLATAPGSGVPGARVLEVPRGIAVVDAKGASEEARPAAREFFALEDDVELSGAAITTPRYERDRMSGEPVIAMGLTDAGRATFAALTRRTAERGAQTVLPTGSNPVDANQRIGIALDDRLLTLITIDFQENPRGIDGRTGVQIDGVGTPAQTRRLALLLHAPALPAHLVPLTPVK